MLERTAGKLKRDVSLIIENIGEVIKTTRTAKKWSMAKLAEEAAISSSLISDLENNKGKTPNIYTLIAIARALDIPDETFIEKIWKNVSKENKVISNDVKLRTALLDYGVPEQYIGNIMDYITFFTAINSIEFNSKVIKETYEKQMALHPGIDNVRIDNDFVKACKDNLEKIATIKENLQK